MRQLHFVKGEAGHVVLRTADGMEQFELAIDEALRDATQPTRKQASVRPPSAVRLSPREIQMRVRAGESAQDLIDSHGASLEWVMRFAAPVLSERQRIANEARRSKARRTSTDGQAVVFGDAVEQRFAAQGINPAGVQWDAYRRHDAQWIVTARWVDGPSEWTAEWGFNLAARTVAPVDDTAADLLSDRPIRPTPATPDPGSPPSLSLAPPLESGVVAFPAMPDAHTGPLPRPEQLFDQANFDEGTPAIGAAAAKKSARPTVPSWDDIMLGVRRNLD